MFWLLPPIIDVFVLIVPYLAYGIIDYIRWTKPNEYLKEKEKYSSYREYVFFELYGRNFFTVLMSKRAWLVQAAWAFIMLVPLTRVS